jgi:hypothetical protein
MKILFNSLLMVAAAGLGLTVGFALRGKSGNVSATAESSTVALASPAVSQEKPARVFNQPISNRRNDDSPLATKLERDLSMSSGVTRWLYWLEALEKAAPADFPRLARLAKGNSTAMRFVAARWVELDPRHLFDTLVAASKSGGGFPSDELAAVLFEEWPKRDPEAVIAAFNGLDASESLGRRNWRMLAAGIVFEKDVERGLRLLSEWRIDNFGPGMTAVAKWAAADPRHAAEFTLEYRAGYASRSTMETIAKEWARTDPGGALGFAATQSGELGSTLGTTVLKEWAGQNLTEAAAWLAGTDVRTRNRLSPTFIEAWAKEDAASALTWCESNLAGSSLAQAVGGVLKGAAERDVAGAARLVAEMLPSAARAEAASAVAQKWFAESFSGKAVPPEAITWLASLDSESMKRALERVQWEWRNSDPKSMAAFLASPAGEQVPAQVYSILAQSMALKNPAEALAWANRLPEDLGLQAGSDAFYEWRRSQPETAMQWLRELPSTDARRLPFFQSAIRSLANDPQAAEQLAAMNPADRTTARTVIETMSLPEDRRARLLEAVRQR